VLVGGCSVGKGTPLTPRCHPCVPLPQEDGEEGDLEEEGDAPPRPRRTLKPLGPAAAALRQLELGRVLDPEFVKRYILYVRRFRYKVGVGWGAAEDVAVGHAKQSGAGWWVQGDVPAAVCQLQLGVGYRHS
jgi:hypothetical protein